MQVKKFEAPTIQEALDTIKRELGPEAIILQTKRNKRGFGLMSKSSVEVTAAVAEKALISKKRVDQKMPESTREAIQRLPAEKQAKIYRGQEERQAKAPTPQVAAPAQARRSLTATRYAEITEGEGVAQPRPVPAVQRADTVAQRPAQQPASSPAVVSNGIPVELEIQRLREMIAEMKNSQQSQIERAQSSAVARDAIEASGPNAFTPAMRECVEQLMINGIDRRNAIQLVKQAAFSIDDRAKGDLNRLLDQVASEIMSVTEVATLLDGVEPNTSSRPAIVALVGPTGVGKTTTVAKIASDAILRKKLRVGLINVDSYRVGAADQLATYAKILNAPFRSVTTTDDLATAVQDFKSFDLILLDTTGRSQKDHESLQEMHEFLSGIDGLRVQLVLAATTRDAEMAEMGRRFQIFKPEALILSKLDEALTHGPVFNISQKLKLPFLYFTTGQRVPEDIEEATCERVASLVMDL